MKVLIVSPFDPAEVRLWSGTPYFISQSIRSFAEVEYARTPFFGAAIKVARKVLSPFGVDPIRRILVSKLAGHFVASRISASKPDVVLGIAASHLLAFVKTDVPIVHLSDATFSDMVGYYPGRFDRLSRTTKIQGDAIEGAVLRRADAIVLSSNWAKAGAIENYSIDPRTVHVLPLGANFTGGQGEGALDLPNVCNLLFVGVDWVRKGGQIAFETAQWLNDHGVDCTLHVVGCDPPASFSAPWLKRYGFISKNTDQGRRTLKALFRDAAFLLVPTRQEAYGLVYAEASTFGVPSIATATGGVPTIIENGVNGYLLSLDASGEQFGRVIAEVWRDPSRYADLRKSTFARGQAEFLWSRWAERAQLVLSNCIAARGASPG